nr:zinc knuckle CX2CX4HX4C [Tanacetum cinerariifolium]
MTTKRDDDYDPYDDDLYDSHDRIVTRENGSGGRRGVKEKQDGSANDVVEATNRVTKSLKTGNMVEDASGHGMNDGMNKGNVGQASLTRGTVPTNSTSAVSRTEVTDASNSTNLTIATNAPNISGVSKSPVKNVDEHDVLLPLASVHGVNDKMKNSLYGYFIGKRLAFPVVEWGGSFRANNEGFIEAKKKKSGGNNGGNKNFKPVSVKPKTYYRPKGNQSNEGASHKMTPSVGKKNVSTLGNGTFPLLSEEKCMLVDDDGKPLEKIDYSGDHGSEDEVESVENEMASYLALKPAGI